MISNFLNDIEIDGIHIHPTMDSKRLIIFNREDDRIGIL